MLSARRVAVIVGFGLLGLLAGYGMVNALDGSEPPPVEPIVLDRVPTQPAAPVTTTTPIPGASLVVPPPTLPPLPPPPPDQPPAPDQSPPSPSDGDDDDDDGDEDTEDADADDREDDEVADGDD